MRRYRHLTPRYVANRLCLLKDERLHPDWPWLTRQMIGILETWLRPGDAGLEFGSGRSTIWLAKRIRYLVSVEHDVKWHARVSAKLGEAGLLGTTVDYRLRPCDPEGDYHGSYVHVVRTLAPASLDFCLVDGVARDHCTLAALDLLKPGGALIIDNANWYIPHSFDHPPPDSRAAASAFASDTWCEVGAKLAGWRNIWTNNGVTATALWLKPV